MTTPHDEDPRDGPGSADAPDAVLLRSGELVQGFVFPRTIPIILCRDTLTPENLAGNHTGVGLKLKERSFLLTSGHTVSDMWSHKVALAISATPMTFEPEVLGSNFELGKSSAGPDYGYVEVSLATMKTAELKSKVFVAPQRLWVGTAADLAAADDWMIMCGAPEGLAETGPSGVRYKQLFLCTTLAGTGVAPASRLPPMPGMQYVDLWTPKNGPVDALHPDLPPVELPRLRGASGCSVWKSNVRPDPATWNTSKIKLVATHVGTTGWVAINGEEHRFSREVLVGHHLRLIAEDHPSLRDEIYGLWPELASWEVLRGD